MDYLFLCAGAKRPTSCVVCGSKSCGNPGPLAYVLGDKVRVLCTNKHGKHKRPNRFGLCPACNEYPGNVGPDCSSNPSSNCKCHGLDWYPATDGWEDAIAQIGQFEVKGNHVSGWSMHVYIGYRSGSSGQYHSEWVSEYQIARNLALYRALESMGATFPAEAS